MPREGESSFTAKPFNLKNASPLRELRFASERTAISLRRWQL
jgi:hypothetical protein